MASNLNRQKLPPGLSEDEIAQLLVLKVLSSAVIGSIQGAPRHVSPQEIGGQMTVVQISKEAGLPNEEAALRCLYNLEGQQFVSPYPLGDLTSRHWFITQAGIDKLRKYSI
jgi:hypothetical protein